MSRLNDEMGRFLSGFQVLEDSNYVGGYVEGESKLKSLLLHHQMLSCAFATRKSGYRNRGPKKIFLNHAVAGMKISLGKTPFIMGRTSFLQCHKGARGYMLKKDELLLQRLRSDHDYLPMAPAATGSEEQSSFDESFTPGKPRKERESKKVNCPAVLYWFEVIYFPKLGLSATLSKSAIAKKMKEIRAAVEEMLVNGDYCQRFYVKLPLEGAHQFHSLVTEEPQVGSLEPVHPKIISKIQEIVYLGIDRIAEIELLLKQYIEYELLPEVGIVPDSTNRSFYPTKEDLRNHVRVAKNKIKKIYGTYPIDVDIDVVSAAAEPVTVEPGEPSSSNEDESHPSTPGHQLRDILKKLDSLSHVLKNEQSLQECVDLANDILIKMEREAFFEGEFFDLVKRRKV